MITCMFSKPLVGALVYIHDLKTFTYNVDGNWSSIIHLNPFGYLMHWSFGLERRPLVLTASKLHTQLTCAYQCELRKGQCSQLEEVRMCSS